jgi:hypothetical protein
MRNVLDGKLAPGACTRVQWLAKCMRTTTSPLYSFPSFLQTVTFFNPLLLHASPLPSAQTPMPPPTRNATLFPLNQHYPPLPLSPLFAPLTRSVSSVLLDSGPLAVESVVGGALELCARGSPATSGGVAESGKRLRGARSGAKAEHGVECELGRLSGEWWRDCLLDCNYTVVAACSLKSLRFGSDRQLCLRQNKVWP